METSLSLDQLQVFLCVVEAGSFSAAARRLNRAQSAVSYAIAHLERSLGLQLFERTGRVPVLTEAGRAILVSARAIGTQIGQLHAKAHQLQRGVEARISLAVDVNFPVLLLVTSLHEFQSKFPGMTLRLHSAALGRVADLVRGGACQLGITSEISAASDSLKKHHLMRLSLCPVASFKHPLARLETKVSTSELRSHPQIVLSDRDPSSKELESGVVGHNHWRVVDLGVKLACIRGGLGWGILPSHLVRTEVQQGSLKRLDFEEWASGSETSMAWVFRASEPPGPGGQWLMKHLEIQSQQWMKEERETHSPL